MSDTSHSGLTSEQGLALVDLVRQTLMARFNRKVPSDLSSRLEEQLHDEALQIQSGTFVTLKIAGQLRGCIGNLVGRDSLVEGVRSNAVSAAFHDPRFSRLTNKELDRVTIEVSVLTVPMALKYAGGDDLVSKLRPGIDGVIIRKGLASATFLPQVWEQLPEPKAFLAHLCNKAGLPDDAWRNGDLGVETYQVQYFEEPH